MRRMFRTALSRITLGPCGSNLQRTDFERRCVAWQRLVAMFLAPPLCVGNEHLLNHLLCNVKIRSPQFDDGSWQVEQISLGCRVQNVECSRDGKSANLGGPIGHP